tara:strand:+ start:871 stop:2418 length:1548 start_codon:yes stop_codon:yes gene_type:complete
MVSYLRQLHNKPIEVERKRKRQMLKDDFIYYADSSLKIRTKDGDIKKLELNKAQLYVHAQIEDQLKQTGKVRALVLKGRQQGVSTYVEGRYYWKVTHRKGVRGFILTHEQQATDNLFEMAQRYHENCLQSVKPQTDTSSAKELSFGRLDSGYKVGTAGSKGVGRSSTIQYFHGSEVAFWPNAETHAVGIMQAIPDGAGTEVILESTANGLGNYFHEQWKEAEQGVSEYIAIFVPWFWQEEYTKQVPDNMSFTDKEMVLKSQYDLSNGQLCWRRNKVIELGTGGVNGETQFKQEYPMNAAEAFQMSGVDTLIKADIVMKARKNTVAGAGPKILGIDPSHGGDRFAMIMRQTRKMYRPEAYTGDDVGTLQKRAAKVIRIIDDEKPDMINIDSGYGVDLADYLIELGYKNINTVSFGGTPRREDRYINKRAEMVGDFADWLNDENADVDVPDSDELHADFCACPYETDVHRRVKILEKKKIKKDFGFSPDYLDAAGLTFAFPEEKAGSGQALKFSGWG